MKRENVQLALSLEKQLGRVEDILENNSFDNMDYSKICDVVRSLDFNKIKPILEEKKKELEEQIEKL